jgi:hypothetical protein
METIQRLEAWYGTRCNGRWEHQWGIRISNIDNPGWSVSIDLNETTIANQMLQPLRVDVSETDWMHCWKDSAKFEGRGDPGKLDAILRHFLRFVEG